MKARLLVGAAALLTLATGCPDFQVNLQPPAAGDQTWEGYSTALRQGDALWQYRHKEPENAEVLEKAIEGWKQAWAVAPEEREPLEKLALAHYYLGRYFREGEAALETYQQGWEYGRLALMTNPEIAAAYEKDAESIHEAIAAHLRVPEVPAAYWFAVNWAKVVEDAGIAQRAVTAPKIKAIMERVYQIGQSYYGYAVHRFFGAYFTKAPGQEDPASQSREQFELAIKHDPLNLETRILMARYYCTLVYDEELYDELVEEVLNAPEGYGAPDYIFENVHAKKSARELKENKWEYF